MSYSSADCSVENSCDCRPDSSIDNVLTAPQIALYFAGLLLFLAAILFRLPTGINIILYIAAYLIYGGPVLFRATKNIARGKVFDENFLMALATIGAFAIGEYPEGVAVMIFYKVGEAFQDHAVKSSRSSIKKLLDILPEYANLSVAGQTRKVTPEMVNIKDLIVVSPGERVPLDGVISEGSSALDISALTGESLPRDVTSGDEILSGSVNMTGLLKVRVTKTYGESTVSRILKLVENASGKKAKTEKFMTRFAAYYTPVVVSVAFLLAVIPPVLIPGEQFFDWIYRALVFLVISCPCALVISIPLGFFGGIGGASKKGILVKGGNHLEALSAADTVIFDKTGTLTEGAFHVKKTEPVEPFSDEDLLRFGAAAAYYSSHPVARSIFIAQDNNIDEDGLKSYREYPGKGVSVTYKKRKILMGNRRLMQQHQVNIPENNDDLHMRVYLAVDDSFAGTICVADELKKDASNAVSRLRKLGIKKIYMLTGDRMAIAEEIGKKLGLDKVYAELLPDQKVELVEKLDKEKTRGKKNVFVGDGINDAPSLARADIGVAMGGVGSDAAIEAADLVLMTGQPTKLVEAIQVSRKTRAIVIQNIILALGIKAVIMVLGLFGMASMWEAVFADVGVALLAVLNAMRALR